MIEQIISCLVGIAFLALAFRLIHKEKYSFALFSFIVALAAFLNSATWFQGLMRTGIIRVVRTTLQSYGDRLDDFQKETEETRTELTNQQSQIKLQQQQLVTQQFQLAVAQSNIFSQQSVISGQFQQVTNLQGELALAQKTISEQAKKLNDVEFLAKNLFANMRHQRISGADSNIVAVHTFTNGVKRVAFRLNEVPIENSVQGTYSSPSQLNIPLTLTPMPQIANIVFGYFAPSVGELSSLNFVIQYVRDSRITNALQKIEFRGDQFFADGIFIPGVLP